MYRIFVSHIKTGKVLYAALKCLLYAVLICFVYHTERIKVQVKSFFTFSEYKNKIEKFIHKRFIRLQCALFFSLLQNAIVHYIQHPIARMPEFDFTIN